MGGIIWDIPPRIIFDSVDGIGLTYSQGFSGFYAMGAVFFFCIGASRAFVFRPIFWTLTVIFAILAAAGGARGDFVAGIIAIVLVIIRNPKTGNIVFAASALLAAVTFLFRNGFSDEIIVFQRLTVLNEGDWGMRDELAAQTFELLSDKVMCLFSGCGFGYFQVYWHYDFGLYPHNSVLEALVTFGLPIGGVLSLLSIAGIARSYFGWGANNPLFYILLVQYLISLKSGSLLDFRSLSLLIVFALIGVTGLGRRVGRRDAHLRSSPT
jgi:hypothetical protein